MKKALLQLHLAVFLAGFTAVLGKLITLNEGALVWFRLLLTVAGLLLLFTLKKEKYVLPIKQALPVIFTGGIVALHWVLFYGSVKYANVSVALVCFSATGFFTSLFEPLLTSKRFSVQEMLLGILAISGIAIIFNFYPQYTLGIVLGIFSAAACAVFPIYNKVFLKTRAPQSVMLYELGGGLFFLSLLLPVYVFFSPAGNYLPVAKDWILLIILALLCTVYTFHLQLSSLKYISAFTANLSYNLEPVYGILLAIIFFNENRELGSTFYAGLSLILVSIGIQTWLVLKPRK